MKIDALSGEQRRRYAGAHSQAVTERTIIGGADTARGTPRFEHSRRGPCQPGYGEHLSGPPQMGLCDVQALSSDDPGVSVQYFIPRPSTYLSWRSGSGRPPQLLRAHRNEQVGRRKSKDIREASRPPIQAGTQTHQAGTYQDGRPCRPERAGCTDCLFHVLSSPASPESVGLLGRALLSV